MGYSVGIAYLLWALGGFGALGFHRFYLRKIPTGALWLFTGGLFYLGAAYDFFTLPRQVREANLRDGYRAAIEGGRETIIIRDETGDYRVGGSGPKESIEKAVLRTAKKNGGLVTPGAIAIESDYTTDEARQALEALAAKGYCEMRVRQSGVIVYRFPEFASGDEKFEPGL